LTISRKRAGRVGYDRFTNLAWIRVEVGDAMPGTPALGFSLFLVTLGAILTFGITTGVEGIDLDAVGVILMVVGLFGIALAMLFWTSWAPYRRGPTVVTDPAIRETTTTSVDPVARRTTTTETVERDPLPPPAP
jgi:hypothetical protein